MSKQPHEPFVRRQVLARLSVLLAFCCSPPLLAKTAKGGSGMRFIFSSHVDGQPNHERLLIESDQELSIDRFTLSSPPRLVIDFKATPWDVRLAERLPDIVAGSSLVQEVRLGPNQPDVVRLVLVLKPEAAVKIESSGGVNGTRFQFDLVGKPLIKAADPTRPSATRGDEASQAPPANAPTDKADKLAKSEKPSSGRYGKTDRLVIAIDPGHGGVDPGAIGKTGLMEKNVTLAIARRLADHLESKQALKVVLTRYKDQFVALSDRVAKARQEHAELFISVHADAWIKPNARGSSVFVLSERGASSSSARWLAKIQNEVDVLGGVNIDSRDQKLAKTLLDLSQSATKHDSWRFGKQVLREIGLVNRLHRGFVEYANFAVLKAPDIPSILLETAFISNPAEEALLRDESYHEKIAQAISQGVGHYFAKTPSKRASG